MCQSQLPEQPAGNLTTKKINSPLIKNTQSFTNTSRTRSKFAHLVVFNSGSCIVPGKHSILRTESSKGNVIFSLRHVHRLFVDSRRHSNHSPAVVSERDSINCFLDSPIVSSSVLWDCDYRSGHWRLVVLNSQETLVLPGVESMERKLDLFVAACGINGGEKTRKGKKWVERNLRIERIWALSIRFETEVFDFVFPMNEFGRFRRREMLLWQWPL